MSLGELNPGRSILMVCDIQEKFGPSILNFDTIVENARRLIQAAKILEVPTLATEQYPKGLGRTVPEILPLLDQLSIIEKTEFTMLVPYMANKLDNMKTYSRGFDTVVLCGIETHVCVIATCQDLIKKGFKVHIAADAVSSRTQTDRILALDRMRQIGAFINTTESIILSWVGDAKHPRFKEVQKLIKEINLDTGLVTNEAAEASIVAKAAL